MYVKLKGARRRGILHILGLKLKGFRGSKWFFICILKVDFKVQTPHKMTYAAASTPRHPSHTRFKIERISGFKMVFYMYFKGRFQGSDTTQNDLCRGVVVL